MLTHSFLGEEDHGLKARLRSEHSGILNWALAGYRRLRQRGRFVQAASRLEATQELEELASPIKAFLAQQCDPSGELPCRSLYDTWKLWCEQNGHTASSLGVFGRDLRAAAPQVKVAQRRAADARSRVYEGISLKPARAGVMADTFLSIRSEGNSLNAYYEDTEGMKDEVLIGSIHLRFCSDEIADKFTDLIKEALTGTISEAGGARTSFGIGSTTDHRARGTHDQRHPTPVEKPA